MKDYYLLVLSEQQKSLRPLKGQFHEMQAFYNGVGYAISSAYEARASELCQAAGLTLHKMPLPLGTNFSSFRQAHKASFLREKMAEIDHKILSLTTELKIDHTDLESLSKDYPLGDSPNEQLLRDFLEDRRELAQHIEHAEKLEKALSLSHSSKIEIKFISEMNKNFLLDEPEEMPRLVDYRDGDVQKPFLPRGIVAMLVGAGGVGKTHALTQLALSIATGSPWLGHFPIVKPGHVFLGLGENKENDIHRLIRKTTKHLQKTAHNQNFNQFQFFEPEPLEAARTRIAPMSFSGVNATFIHKGEGTAFFDGLLNNLKRAEPEEGWACIILDPISRFIGLDAESDNAAATQFISLLEKMSMELKGNPTIIFGHHMNKGGIAGNNTDQAAARGSSAITDGVRWQVNLERVKSEMDGEDVQNEIAFRHVKSNFTPLLKKYILKKDDMGCLTVTDQMSMPIFNDLGTTPPPKSGIVRLGLVKKLVKEATI